MDARGADIPLTTGPEQRLALLWNTIDAAMYSRSIESVYQRIIADNPSPGQFVSRVLRYIQDLPRIPDPPGRERFQSVEETLRRGGDCEDHAAALVALLEIESRRNPCTGGMLRWMNLEPNASMNHVTALVTLDCGVTWHWAEPSIRYAEIGEEPFAAATRTNDWSGFNAV